jgi:hypothetical protein
VKIKAPFKLEQYRRNKNGVTFLRVLSTWGSVWRMTGLLTLGSFGRANSWTYFTNSGKAKL